MGNEDYVNLTSVDGKVMEEYVPHTAIVPTAAVVTKMISVIAPTDLAPGYQFEAEANGERYKVTVVSLFYSRKQRGSKIILTVLLVTFLVTFLLS
jgi:hypothetical protein